jgi:hypothetical protein
MFRIRKRSDGQKKKSEEQREETGVQAVYSHERYGDWFWLSNEAPVQVCRRLDARQRRLNSELLRAIDEGATQKVVRYMQDA